MKNSQPLALAVTLVVGLWLGRGCGGWSEDTAVAVPFHGQWSDGGDQARLLNILNRVEDLYVDTFDRSRLVDAAIEAMLEELDPHTVYYSGEELSAMTENMEGNFEGIGVEFIVRDDTLMVVAAIPGGPAEGAGMRAGDRILEVDGAPISGPELTNRRVMELLKGPRGTEVTLGLARQNDRLQVQLTRDRIPIQSVVAAFTMDDNVGYIKAIRFAANTAQEFEAAMVTLTKQGAQSAVVDLRGNGGGYLNAWWNCFWTKANPSCTRKANRLLAARTERGVEARMSIGPLRCSWTKGRHLPVRFLPARCKTTTAVWWLGGARLAKASCRKSFQCRDLGPCA